VRVLLADEQLMFREAIRVALENETDMHVVADVADGLTAVAEAERLSPDVALLQANLPQCNGAAVAKLLKIRLPDCKALVLSHAEDQEMLAACLEAGATGYLTRQSSLRELVDAVRGVHGGEMLVPSRMLSAAFAKLLWHRKEYDDVARRIARLTPREREVLRLLAEGGGNEAIGNALLISPQTARTHIQKVIKKLGVHSRLEAALLVTQNGVFDELRVDRVPSPAGNGEVVLSRQGEE
jgi:two-component system, NarL family, nitrate/nitrite response regulator NarL